jgi:hypothetical protein
MLTIYGLSIPIKRSSLMRGEPLVVDSISGVAIPEISFHSAIDIVVIHQPILSHCLSHIHKDSSFSVFLNVELANVCCCLSFCHDVYPLILAYPTVTNKGDKQNQLCIRKFTGLMFFQHLL